MPAYAQNPANYLGNTIAAAQNTARAGVKQSTQYVVNPKEPEQCEAIIGALGYDNKGVATGLKTGTSEVYGIAVYMASEWHRVVVAQAWTSVSYGTKIEEYGAPYQSPRVRIEGARVWFRGLLKVKAGGYTGGETMLTLPEGFRPPATIELSVIAYQAGNEAVTLVVSPSGKVESGSSFLVNASIPLDGLSFNLT